jgi:hypothetical protein
LDLPGVCLVLLGQCWFLPGFCRGSAWWGWFSPWLGVVFHPLSASAESDGARKASSATFFHRPEAYLYHDGLKNLVPAHFSNSQKFNSNLMD